MAIKNMIRVLCAVLVICFAVCGLSACSGDADKKADKVTVVIDDAGKKTEVEVEAGVTVADALKEAKITLGENDTVEPKADAKITADTKTITVTRVAATEAPTEAPTEKPTEKPTEAPKTEAPTEAPTEAQPADNGDDNGGNEDYNNDDNDGNADDGGDADDGGVYEVSREAMPDCDGSGHGYYIITYSDGSTGTEEY